MHCLICRQRCMSCSLSRYARSAGAFASTECVPLKPRGWMMHAQMQDSPAWAVTVGPRFHGSHSANCSLHQASLPVECTLLRAVCLRYRRTTCMICMLCHLTLQQIRCTIRYPRQVKRAARTSKQICVQLSALPPTCSLRGACIQIGIGSSVNQPYG